MGSGAFGLVWTTAIVFVIFDTNAVPPPQDFVYDLASTKLKGKLIKTIRKFNRTNKDRIKQEDRKR